MLDVAARLDDLEDRRRVTGWNRWRGAARAGTSIRVNDQYRITFRWEQGHAWEV